MDRLHRRPLPGRCRPRGRRRWSKRRRSVRCSTNRPPAIRPSAAGWWWPSWDIPPAARLRPANRRSLSFVSCNSLRQKISTLTPSLPANADIVYFVRPSWSLEGRPSRLLHLALAGHQAFLNAPIRAHQRQDTTPPIPGGIDDFGAVRRIARRHVEVAPGQDLHIASPAQVHNGNAVAPLLLRHEGELRFIRRQTGPRVVGVLEGEAPRLVAGLDADAVDLRTSRAIRCEIQASAVVRPLRFGVDPRIVGDAGQRLTRQIQRIDVEVSVAGGERT